ncbi:MAG: phage tail assembly chaperone [Dehalococcoidia bacterium]
MFKLKPNPTFFAKVDIPVPGSDPASLDIEFRHMRREDAAEFARGLGERDPMESLRQVVVGWKGVAEEFSDGALAELHANYAGAADRILAAYFDELRGARRKN